jgi:hypothetical protein
MHFLVKPTSALEMKLVLGCCLILCLAVVHSYNDRSLAFQKCMIMNNFLSDFIEGIFRLDVDERNSYWLS